MCLKVCFAVYKWFTGFNLLCTKFDLAFNLCSFNDAKCRRLCNDFIIVTRNWVFMYIFLVSFHICLFQWRRVD